jgi:hypothetical protein
MLAGRIGVFGAILGLLLLSAPAAADPSDFAQEFADRLAESANLAAADREDRAALAKFYAGRQQEPVWIAAGGLTPAPRRRSPSCAAPTTGASMSRPSSCRLCPAPPAPSCRAPAVPMPRSRCSLAILKYARHARGGRAEPTSLSRNLDRKLPLLDPGQVIDQASKASSPDAYLRSLHPQHPQFEALRQKYLALKQGRPIAQSDPNPPEEGKKGGKKKAAAASRGARHAQDPHQHGGVALDAGVARRLLRLGQHPRVHPARHQGRQGDPHRARHRRQARYANAGLLAGHGAGDLPPVLGDPRVHQAQRRAAEPGARQLPGRGALQPAHPARRARYRSGLRRLGQRRHPPVPRLPAARSHQRAGRHEVPLPNKHDVYMHDTPTKNLFNAEVRTFSHGCVRVREPQRLAELVLAEDQDWTAARVAAAIKGGPQNNQISLTRKVPVHITYFTAMVDHTGGLRQFSDIYGHEQRIALGMEGKAHLVARLVKEDKPPTRADAVGSLAETTTGGGPGGKKKDWVRRAFDFGNN